MSVGGVQQQASASSPFIRPAGFRHDGGHRRPANRNQATSAASVVETPGFSSAGTVGMVGIWTKLIPSRPVTSPAAACGGKSRRRAAEIPPPCSPTSTPSAGQSSSEHGPQCTLRRLPKNAALFPTLLGRALRANTSLSPDRRTLWIRSGNSGQSAESPALSECRPDLEPASGDIQPADHDQAVDRHR